MGEKIQVYLHQPLPTRPNSLGRVWQYDVTDPNQLGRECQYYVTDPNQYGRSSLVYRKNPLYKSIWVME